MRRIAPTHTTSNPKSKWVCQKLYATKNPMAYQPLHRNVHFGVSLPEPPPCEPKKLLITCWLQFHNNNDNSSNDIMYIIIIYIGETTGIWCWTKSCWKLRVRPLSWPQPQVWEPCAEHRCWSPYRATWISSGAVWKISSKRSLPTLPEEWQSNPGPEPSARPRSR